MFSFIILNRIITSIALNFLSVWITKSQRIVTSFASLIGFHVYTIFQNAISHSFYILMLSLFGSSIPSALSLFPLFIINTAHFSMSISIPISWLNILMVCNRISGYFFFFEDILISSPYTTWLIFSCDFVNLLPPPLYFLSK